MGLILNPLLNESKGNPKYFFKSVPIMTNNRDGDNFFSIQTIANQHAAPLPRAASTARHAPRHSCGTDGLVAKDTEIPLTHVSTLGRLKSWSSGVFSSLVRPGIPRKSAGANSSESPPDADSPTLIGPN